MTRLVAISVIVLAVGACTSAGDVSHPSAEEISYHDYLLRNSANSAKLSIGTTKAQVLSTMGDNRTQVHDGPLANPWKVEAFVHGDDTYEVLYYLVRRHPPFTPISEHQAISVVIKNGSLIAWGRKAEARFR